MDANFKKKEKLKSIKTIEALFAEGKSMGVFPLRLFYLELPETEKQPYKTAVSVSKKNFKLAVDRNRIKRLLREAYRLNKSILYDGAEKKYAILILYVGKEMTNFNTLDRAIKTLMVKFLQQTKN
jgi:ribonuclease P protein component